MMHLKTDDEKRLWIDTYVAVMNSTIPYIEPHRHADDAVTLFRERANIPPPKPLPPEERE